MGKGFSFGGKQPRRDSEWIRPGVYLVRIESFKKGANRKGREYMHFTMLNCHTIDDSLGASVKDGSQRAGDKLSWRIMAEWDGAEGTIMSAIQTLTGLPIEELQDDNVYDQLTAASQPLAGLYARVEARQIQTQSGNPFTAVTIKTRISASEAKEMVPEAVASTLGLEFDED